MVGLSVKDDKPPNSIQHRLMDGIHLRWAFKRDRGFPWYGYYLFRRIHGSGDIREKKLEISHLQAGSTTIDSLEGQITSDSTLIIVNFPPTGEKGLDLDGRSYIDFFPSSLAYKVKLRIGFLQDTEIKITAIFAGKAADTNVSAPVAQVIVKGQAGKDETVLIEFDAISGINISSGPAVLTELSFRPVTEGNLPGWVEVPNFPYSMSLPVIHKDYPCNKGAINQRKAEKIALNRILYGDASDWEDWAAENFEDFHYQLLRLVEGGPHRKQSMANKFTPPPSPLPQPHMPKQYPLDLIVLSALNPAIAQMIGLYWVDQTVNANNSYDYLIVAAHKSIGSNATDALRWLRKNGFDDVDAFIVFNKSIKEPMPPLDIPSGLKTYALPGGGLQPGITTSPQTENNVGLRWDLGVTDFGVLLPGKPVMHHLWRSDLGNNENPNAPGSYELITQNGPVLVVTPATQVGTLQQRPKDWPPDRLHYIDSGLADGWYSFQVSGIDIFGRHSPNSQPGPWYQWTPVPDPCPWYYKNPPSDSIIHPLAVRLLDKMPPPPPTGIEAYALDPGDPTLLKDTAYNAWHNSLTASTWYKALTEEEKKNLMGLRVRWLWTHSHMRQAPDTREFRIYYHPDHMNVLMGNMGSVTVASSTQSDVETDIPNTLPADAYKDKWLQVGQDAFKIVSSQAGTPLLMRVENIGPNDDIKPQPNVPCSLVISEEHPGYKDYSEAINWQERYYVVDYNSYVTKSLVLSHDMSGNELKGSAAVVSGAVISLDGTPDLIGIQMTGEHLFLDDDTISTDKTYPIINVDNQAKTVTVEGRPNISGISSPWKIGFPLSTYEVFLPAPGDTYHAGLLLNTTLIDPIKYAYVSVSAADDKAYTLDKITSGRWGNLYGNEGPVGARAKIFRVRRKLPPAPKLPPADSEKVYSTPADYHNRSFYTFRWVPVRGVKTHIFRALDESIFSIDWDKQNRITLDPKNKMNHRKLFPSQATEPRWGSIKCQQIANEINALNTLKASGATWEEAMVEYHKLSNDSLRVLAGLTENESAFTQLTILPLDSNDPANIDCRGPNDPDNYTANSGWRAYVDKTLDGRSSSRYFYRAGSVDSVHNRSKELSLSSPPVYCPDVVPPRTPVITKVFAGPPDPAIPGDTGDRRITLKWASNREPDLKEYRIYRADSKEGARDLRMMTLVHTEPVMLGDSAARPEEVGWTDKPVPGLVTFYYRLVAVDKGDPPIYSSNVSEPSFVAAARAFDDLRPKPPVWNPPMPGINVDEIVLSWSSRFADLACLIERRAIGEMNWTALSGWLSRGSYMFKDNVRATGITYQYRLRIIDKGGRQNDTFNILTG